MKKTILVILATISLTSASGANIVGKWTIKHFQKETVGRMIPKSILGSADEIEFKLDGKFFANDTIYGTYQMVNNRVVLTRDKAFVNLFMDNFNGAADGILKNFIVEGDSGSDTVLAVTLKDNAIMKEVFSEYRSWYEESYANDTASMHFGPRGNTVLMTIDEDDPLYFELQRKGTKAENLNEDRNIVGTKWTTDLSGIYTTVREFGKDSIYHVRMQSLSLSSETKNGKSTNTNVEDTKYTVDRDKIIFHRASGDVAYRWIMPTNKKLLLVSPGKVLKFENE